jgi:enterochelin esterase-like enzyme
MCRLVFALLLIAAVSSSALAQTAASQKTGTVERVKVHGASLAGNLEGDAADRDVFIYLPPGYAANRNQRYPVVYLLHGYGLTAERWMPFTNLAATADKLMSAGTIREMIFVSPDAYTIHGGSMYSASVTTGDWETFIAEDLVAYVDKTYRTIPTRDSRGLAGHSMGGYGTLRIGMKRPDVFSAMYPMSSCCLIDANIAGGGRGGAGRGAGAGAPAGRAGAPGAAAAPATAAPAAPAAPAANQTPATAPQAAGTQGDGRGRGAGAGAGRGGRGGRGGGFGNVQFALAAAWAPNPKNPPNFFDLPTVDGVPQPLVVAKFAANSPFVMIPQYATNLKKYKAIKMDVGDSDGLAGQNRQVDESLSAFGIAHAFEVYEGDHSNRVPHRFETSVMPFFSSMLSFTAPKR